MVDDTQTNAATPVAHPDYLFVLQVGHKTIRATAAQIDVAFAVLGVLPVDYAGQLNNMLMSQVQQQYAAACAYNPTPKASAPEDKPLTVAAIGAAAGATAD